MINHTHLGHISIGIKIFLAMRKAIKTGLPQYVTNRKGKVVLRVNHHRGQPSAFQFWDSKTQANITNVVLKALRGC